MSKLTSTLRNEQITVLVVDSVMENIEMLSEDLQADGYSVLSTTKGLDGIALAQQNQVDVILLDVMTADIDGFQVCRLLKADRKTAEIPIILISAREDMDDMIVGLDLGATDYISKPFHYPIAAARIRSAVRVKKSQLNIQPSAELSPELLLVGKRVLLVEDNKPNQIYVMALLNKTAAKVDIAEDGKQAVEMFTNEAYDLVLMDCHMPLMNGYDAAKAIRKREDNSKNVIIIAMTGNTLSEDKNRCLEVGMNDFLSKPFVKDDFFTLISRWNDKL